MANGLRRLAVFSSLLCSSYGILCAQQDRVTGRIDNGQTAVLRGRVNPRANAANDRGPVPGGFQMPEMMLLLKPSAGQQSALQQLIAQQQDPSSPSFHKWLTPEQYADNFGVSAADLGSTVQWLQSQGFTIGNIARSRTWVAFSGTAAQAEIAFHTPIHHYNVNGEAHYGNSTDPSVPAALANVVAGFRGLNDFHPKPRAKKAAPEMTSSGGTHHMAPDDFATIYDVAPLYQAGVDGTGQTIAIPGQSNINVSDNQAFRTKFNLSPLNNVTKVQVGRSNPGFVSGDQDESNLDVEWSGAVARNATILFYYSTDVWTSAIYAIDQNQAQVLSMSYGNCEPSDLVDLPSFQAAAQQANAQGMTFLAASGDSGAADCEDPTALLAQSGLAVDVPAAIPEVTAMGGTTLSDQGGAYWSATNTANGASALSYIPEVAWNETNLGQGLAGTGGGASVFFPRPSWQIAPGVPNDAARHVPDLAFSAAASHVGYYVYTTGSATYFGGTSVATPTMAGVVALLNQYLVSTGVQTQHGVGNINPTLYRMARDSAVAASVFHDVTGGDNIVPCVTGSPNCPDGSLGYSAVTGYDQATGLGSVDASNLVHAWSSKPAVSSAVVPSIDQNPVFQTGTSWSFQLTLTEEAGIGATLTGFTVDGVAQQIPALFGSAAIPADKSISATMTLQNVAVPKTVVFAFSGTDAGGMPWTTQLAVPFSGAQTLLTVREGNNAASGLRVYAPGMLMAVYGTAFGTSTQSAGAIPLPSYMAGFEAYFIQGSNTIPAPLYYVSPTQVNLQIPYEMSSGTATLVLGNPFQNFNYSVTISPVAPGIFLTYPDGFVNPSKSGSRGQQVFLYITGEGRVTPSLATGETPSARTPQAQLPKPLAGYPTVTVGGVPAGVDFVGITSGLVGVTQINFTVPPTAPLGIQPVVVTVGGVASASANFTVTQ
jgi:uncharacterized protein (TIGR03437 family)